MPHYRLWCGERRLETADGVKGGVFTVERMERTERTERTTLSSGRVKLVDPTAPAGAPVPEDLDLEKVLGDMPKKTYDMKRMPFENDPVKIPDAATASEALDRVLQLPSVCSKR